MSEKTDQPAPLPTPSLFPLKGQGLYPDHPLRRGDPCPNCGEGKLDYNGLLELTCEHCGFTLSGGAGCT